MRYSYNATKHVEVELSSFCNAACPQCPRNVYGGKTIDDLPLQSWTYEEYVTAFPKDTLQKLESMYFCGTFGDPMSAKDVLRICEYVKDCNPHIKLGLHTNGGLRTKTLYTSLADVVDYIVFGIDGLEDTNHLYRRHVRFPKVIENATTFIAAGGIAEWDFIVFRHNQHQVETAKAYSEKLGFRKFNIKKTSRFLNKAHVLVDSLDVQNDDGEKEYTIYPPTDTKYFNKTLNTFKQTNIHNYAMNTTIECFYCTHDMIYIDVTGIVWPCGWVMDRLYGVEAKQTRDHQIVKGFLDQVNEEDTNCKMNNIESIIHGPWFNMLQDTWTNNNRLERCGLQCGKINHIAGQNIDVEYKN